MMMIVVVIVVRSWLGSQVGQVDVSLSAIDDGVGIFDSAICCLTICHRYKAIPSALSCLTICDHHCFLYLAKCFKKFTQRLVCRMVRQSADKDLGERRVLDTVLMQLLLQPVIWTDHVPRLVLLLLLLMAG